MDTAVLSSQLQSFCEANRISGVIRVTHKDQILHSQSFGYACRETQTPFAPDSMFSLYSLSKPFCAIGLLLLADQGLVDIDAHPGKYVPEANGFDSRVTIRQLLQHTSGLPDFASSPGYMAAYAPGYPSKAREHLQILSGFPNFFAPGTADRYSNIGYIISALIIENVSGLSYAEYMRKAVFDPLGAKTAVVDNETLQIPNRVQGYVLRDGQVCPTEKDHNWMLGAGDVVGTADDVYALNRAVKHRLLLKPETWDLVLTPSPLNKKGLGCAVTKWHGKPRIQHNGGASGFRTLHIHLPEEDFDIIFLSNSGYGDSAPTVRSEVSEIVYRAFFDASAASEKPLEMDTGYVS